MPATVMSRFSYPKVPGDALWSVVDVTGPASYVPIAPGATPTGGQLVTAADCGLQSIDWVVSMGSSNGQASINCIPAAFSPGNPLSGVRLQWILSATGQEVGGGNPLAAITVRLLVIGR